MANDTNAFGLRPVKHINGSPWNGLTEKCYINTDYATALYIGDPVQITTDLSASDATALYSSVELATAGYTNPIYGVITSFDLHEDTSDQKVYKPVSTERYINVCVDPTVIYHIRDDGGSVPTAAWPFLNADFVYAAGSAITGLSGVLLDGTTPAITQTYQLTIIRRANLPENELAINAVWEVMINTHQLLNGGAVGNVLGVTKA